MQPVHENDDAARDDDGVHYERRERTERFVDAVCHDQADHRQGIWIPGGVRKVLK
ncbi:MAG: hypothetical protein AAGB46_12175 [Verrucomicrobiota bacterium]